MKNDEVVIIGGGIVGIFSAIYLKKFFQNVTLIEKDLALGGLLKSFKNENGVTFDYGTHIPCQTMIPEIDNLLFKDINVNDWEVFNNLKVGNFFAGIFNNKSGFVNTLDLPKEQYLQGMLDFLNGEGAGYHTEDLKDYLVSVYGKTFTNSIYEPLLRKLVGEPLDQLHTNAFKIFDISRLIVGDNSLSIELKKSDKLDSKSAFPDYSKGASKNNKFYPKNNRGIVKWIEDLTDQAIQKGVSIKRGCSIESLNFDGEKITELKLDNGDKHNPESIIWTIAPQALSNILEYRIDYCPKFRKTILYNFVLDKDFKVDKQYIYGLDPDVKTFRITLYPNLSNSLKNLDVYNCTVEVFLDKEVEVSETVILEELIRMGIIDETHKIVSCTIKEIKSGFPVITKEYVEKMKEQQNIIEEKIKNVCLLGKAKGNKFFMLDTIVEAYEVLSEKYAK